MKDFNRERAFNLTIKQFILLLASCLIVLFTACLIESTSQLKQAKTVFNNNVDKLVQQHQQNEKRTDILLDALAQYYETNLIKSSHEFEHFADRKSVV